MKSDERSSTDERIERALQELDIAPAPDLAARIIARLPPSRAANPLLGAATMLAALLGVALAYQTAFDLHTNGAFELLSYYTAQPAIVTTYPGEALGALAQAIPWLTVLLGASVLGIALYLVQRLTANARVAVARRT
ncbi:MAG: hypothetical protein HY741_10870 [Chloroflexi bacterium]|nr:hypothetical protein [Chloroflexota bacterium]